MGKVVQSILEPVTSLLGIEKPEIPQPVVVPAAEVPPVVTPPKEMPNPTASSTEVRAAQRRSVADQKKRRGRASTILTTNLTDTETLG